MEKDSVYKKPQITRIKLNAAEAIMANCQSTTQRNVLIKNSVDKTCATAGATNCRNPIS